MKFAPRTLGPPAMMFLSKSKMQRLTLKRALATVSAESGTAANIIKNKSIAEKGQILKGSLKSADENGVLSVLQAPCLDCA